MDAPPTPADEHTAFAVGQLDATSTTSQSASNATSTPQLTSWDWTSVLPDSEHTCFFRSTDWASTRLGPLQEWDQTLRQATCHVMADSRAACLYWGPHLVAVYNAAFAPHAGKKHPLLMGSGFSEENGFPELWPHIKPLFEQGRTSGVAQDVIEEPMTTERNGYLEETFFTGNFTPIRGFLGKIEGFYNAVVEVTKQLIAERRTAMLNAIFTVRKLSTEDACQHIMKCLEMNPLDVTMAMLYQVDNETDPGRSILRLGNNHLGFPPGHNLLVDGQPMHSSEGLIPLCLRARSGSRPLTLNPDDKFRDIEWRGPAGPSFTVAVLPLVNGQRLYGFLIIGTNPRLEDRINSQLVNDLSRTVSSLLASVVSAEEAALRQARLERDLANSDMKIRHLVQHASVGMVHILLDGSTLWANEQYFSIIGLTAIEAQKDFSFFSQILDEDLHIAEANWQSLLEGKGNMTAELRMKRLYQPPVGEPVYATVLIFGFPYIEDGKIGSFMACMTDVSRLKWAENWQTRLAQEAQEAKRQQEAFVDVVSHEIRNPLSAIVHCVDQIIDAVKTHRSAAAGNDALMEIIDAAKIIETCVNHQKYIIDSILTIGRLHSDMLSFTPTRIKPSLLCKSAMDMFSAQLRYNDIATSVIAHSSLAKHNVEEVFVDASRITQVFINLINNAIKFVNERPTPQIKVRYGACVSSPRDAFSKDVHWPIRAEQADDVTQGEEWGTGEQIFLTFSVNDSGIGIGNEEISEIFGRFRQANIKTHSVYGGSGLGLFICKQLAEKHGGEIGVRSTLGEGSSFVFYIRVRKAPPDVYSPLSSPSPDLVIGTSPPPQQGALRVLLVEDNLVNQKLLRKQLTKAGCVVHVANHGVEALAKLKESDIIVDVILMDTQMPVMDGLECTREIRKLEKENGTKSRVPIIAVTANARREQIEEALENGADAVMQKPFKTSDLVNAMNENIAKYATNNESVNKIQDRVLPRR